MHFTQTMKLGLAFAGLCALGTAARPAEAQAPAPIQTYTLSGVTFADGGTASGSFVYDPALGGGFGSSTPLSSFNITTTKGTTGSFAGYQYGGGSLGTAYLLETGHLGHNGSFVFNNLSLSGNGSGLYLAPGALVAPGEYALIAGFDDPNLGASGSSENTGFPSTTRQITGGFLIETPAAVPEASTTVSFGLLLALGLGGTVVAARKKKAAI